MTKYYFKMTRQIAACLLTVVTVCVCAFIFPATAYADEQMADDLIGGGSGGSATDTTISSGSTSGLSGGPAEAVGAWNYEIGQFGRIFSMVAASGGAFGLAWCGLEYAYGSEETARRAKSRAIVIAAAVLALALLPMFVSMAITLFQQYKWTPNMAKKS